VKARLGKGTLANGKSVVAIIVESDDGLHTSTVCMPPDQATAFAEQMRLAAIEVGSGIVIPSPRVPT